jgi:hypothetical protein
MSSAPREGPSLGVENPGGEGFFISLQTLYGTSKLFQLQTNARLKK